MDDQRIKMHSRQVVMVLSNGSRMEGEVFLGLYEAHRNGPQKLGDLLNGENGFLPIRTAEGVLLVNLALIVSVSTETAGEADDLMRLGEKYRIQVTTLTGEDISAELFVNLPPDRRRVKDALNQPQRFLPLFMEEKILYLNTGFILSVRD